MQGGRRSAARAAATAEQTRQAQLKRQAQEDELKARQDKELAELRKAQEQRVIDEYGASLLHCSWPCLLSRAGSGSD